MKKRKEKKQINLFFILALLICYFSTAIATNGNYWLGLAVISGIVALAAAIKVFIYFPLCKIEEKLNKKGRGKNDKSRD